MKKTSDSEPRAKRPRISKSGLPKSSTRERSSGNPFRTKGDESSEFGGRRRTSDREDGSTGSEFRKKGSGDRKTPYGKSAQGREPWKKDAMPTGRQAKPRRSDSGPWKAEGGSKPYSRTRRTDGDSEAPVKQSREYKKDFRKPDKEFRSKDSGNSTSSSGRPASGREPWKKDSIPSGRQAKPRRSDSGSWKAEGGSRKISRVRKPEGESEAPVKQSREYKKDFRKPDKEFRTKDAGNSTTSSGRPPKDRGPWKKDTMPSGRQDKPRSQGSGPWRTEGGTRAPYRRPRKEDGETEGTGKKPTGYKKDFRAPKGEPRKFAGDAPREDKVATKRSDRMNKVVGDPWSADNKPRSAKSKSRKFGKGPGNDPYKGARKGGKGPYKKKY
jgi:hypothetical protein